MTSTVHYLEIVAYLNKRSLCRWRCELKTASTAGWCTRTEKKHRRQDTGDVPNKCANIYTNRIGVPMMAPAG